MRLGLFVPTFIKDFNRVSASIWIRAYQMIPYLWKLGVNVHVNNPFLPHEIPMYWNCIIDVRGLQTRSQLLSD